MNFVIKFWNSLFSDNSFTLFLKDLEKCSVLFPFAKNINNIDENLKKIELGMSQPTQDAAYVMSQSKETQVSSNTNYFNYASSVNQKLRSNSEIKQ